MSPLRHDKVSSGGAHHDLAALRMDPEAHATAPGRYRIWLLAAFVVALLLAMLGARPLLFPPRVETATVQALAPAQAATILTATGYTYARRKASVGAKIVGRIVELRVDEGDTVHTGDVIVRLDSRDLDAALLQAEARLAEAQANLADARREWNRQEGLFAKEAVAEESRDAARTRYDVSEAKVRTAEAELAAARAQSDYATIRAPLDGVILERNAELGEMVAPGGFTSQQSTGAIVRIADPASLEVEADINESYIARLEVGQPALVQVDAVPDHTYHGKLRQIVPTGDRQKAVVEVKVSLEDRDRRLVPDMGCKVTFLETAVEAEAMRREPTLWVPAAAVGRDGGETYVFLVRGGRLQRTPVVLGQSGDNGQAIASGLLGGEVVVVGDLARLRDGQRVRSE